MRGTHATTRLGDSSQASGSDFAYMHLAAMWEGIGKRLKDVAEAESAAAC